MWPTGSPQPGDQAADPVEVDAVGEVRGDRQPYHRKQAVEGDQPALAVEAAEGGRPAAQSGDEPGRRAGAEVGHLQPVHQQVVAVEREERVEVEGDVEVPGEGELEGPRREVGDGQGEQLRGAGQDHSGHRARGRGHQPGAAPGHPDIGGIHENRRDPEVDQETRRRYPPSGVFGRQRVPEFVAGQCENVEPQQDQRTDRVRAAGQEDRFAALRPGPPEGAEAGQRDDCEQYRRDPGEQQPPAGLVQHGNQRVDGDDQQPLPARGGEQPPAQPRRPGPAVHPVQPAERIDRQLLQHPVGREVGDDPGHLVRGQLAGDPGELGDQPGHRPRPVHQPGQRQLVGRQAQITASGTVG